MSRILIVDDEPDILLMLRINLEAEGHQTVLAADGEQALERIDEHHPDLVLLDVMMPVLDGWGVLRRLSERADAPPVIVVSAKSGRSDILRALELGAVDYVAKPFKPSDLVELVAGTLDRSPEERADRRQEQIERHTA